MGQDELAAEVVQQCEDPIMRKQLSFVMSQHRAFSVKLELEDEDEARFPEENREMIEVFDEMTEEARNEEFLRQFWEELARGDLIQDIKNIFISGERLSYSFNRT